MNGLSQEEIQEALRFTDNQTEVVQTSQQTSQQNSSVSLGKFKSNGTTTSGLKIFGMDFFQNQVGMQDRPEGLPTPSQYILGPKDQLSVVIYGSSQKTYSLTINNDGKVFIPLIGPIHLQGLTVEGAKVKLRNALSSIYSGLNGSKQTVFLELSLQSVRSIEVQVLGEVRQPGSYLIPAYSSVFNLLVKSGGPTSEGTFRRIKVYRLGEEVGTFDLYQVFMFGDTSEDIQLNNGDIVVVSPYLERVEVSGAVRRPMYYELVDEESIVDLVKYAGGFSMNAFKERVALQRNGGANQRAIELDVNDIKLDFQDGDKITIWSDFDPVKEQVQVEGAVIRPGPYAWIEGLTLRELFEKAGGLRPDASLLTVTVFSQSDNLEPQILRDWNDSLDILDQKLRAGDLVNIPSFFEVEEYNYIQLEGDVYSEGLYPYFKHQTVLDAIIMAGGLKNSAFGGRVEIARLKPETNEYEILSIDIPDELDKLLIDEDFQLLLKPFDRAYVRTIAGRGQPIQVELSGEVSYPGTYILSESKQRISALIDRSGGLTADAYPAGAALYRRNENFQPDDSREERLAKLLQLKKNVESSEVFSNGLNPAVLTSLENQIGRLSKQIFIARQSEIEKRNRKLTNALDTAIINQSLGAGFKVNEVNTVPISVSFNQNKQRQLIGAANSYDKVGIKLEKILADPGGDEDIVLLPGDKLVIPRLEQTVRIRGEILYPTTVKYSKSKGFRKYISQAGGFSLQAKPGLSYIIYPNGQAERAKRFVFFRIWPDVKPGAEIVVAGGRKREGLRGLEQVFGILTGAASVVTSFVLIQNLSESGSSSNP